MVDWPSLSALFAFASPHLQVSEVSDSLSSRMTVVVDATVTAPACDFVFCAVCHLFFAFEALRLQERVRAISTARL